VRRRRRSEKGRREKREYYCVLQALHMPTPCCIIASSFVPWTPILVCISSQNMRYRVRREKRGGETGKGEGEGGGGEEGWEKAVLLY
jgi:hypothetical protein